MDEQEALELMNYISCRKYPPIVSDVSKRRLRRQRNMFSVDDGTLYYSGETSNDKKRGSRDDLDREKIEGGSQLSKIDKPVRKKVVIGQAMRDIVLRDSHIGPDGSHYGVTKSFHRMDKYWWRNMFNDIRDYVARCDVCCRPHTSNMRQLRHFMETAETAPDTNKIFWRWSIDILGPFKPVAKGKKFIAVATEFVTKTCEVKAIRHRDAYSVADFAVKLTRRYGMMRVLQTDMGPPVCASLNMLLNKALCVEANIALPAAVSKKQVAERFNSQLCSTLVQMCRNRPDDWNTQIDVCAFNYRSKDLSPITKSPFEQMYGVAAVHPSHCAGASAASTSGNANAIAANTSGNADVIGANTSGNADAINANTTRDTSIDASPSIAPISDIVNKMVAPVLSTPPRKLAMKRRRPSSSSYVCVNKAEPSVSSSPIVVVICDLAAPDGRSGKAKTPSPTEADSDALTLMSLAAIASESCTTGVVGNTDKIDNDATISTYVTVDMDNIDTAVL